MTKGISKLCFCGSSQPLYIDLLRLGALTFLRDSVHREKPSGKGEAFLLATSHHTLSCQKLLLKGMLSTVRQVLDC